jgi:hypothetical protein
MADFREVLDIGVLDDHEIGHIEYILNSPAYGDHFEPYLKRMRDRLNQLLLDPSEEREKMYPYKFLIGGICMIDGLLELFGKLISETRIERMARAVTEKTPNQQYQQMREQGLVKPSGMTAQPAEPGYDPAEDY